MSLSVKIIMHLLVRIAHRLSTSLRTHTSRNLWTVTSRYTADPKNTLPASGQSHRLSTCVSKTLLFRAPTLPVCHDDDTAHLPDTITITFVTKDGTRIEVKGREGERAMYLAHRKGIDMEGACEASLACTTW